MSHETSAFGSPAAFGGDSFVWVHALPDGAVSVEEIEGTLVLRASQKLQERFENLLAKRKSGSLSADEREAYQAICELDDA
ncbi:MAG: hypothetical protein KY475_19475, partial [Planctomycetes bacterium]|nr:hypothetical protein [Planctomycetota bacterium]